KLRVEAALDEVVTVTVHGCDNEVGCRRNHSGVGFVVKQQPGRAVLSKLKLGRGKGTVFVAEVVQALRDAGKTRERDVCGAGGFQIFAFKKDHGQVLVKPDGPLERSLPVLPVEGQLLVCADAVLPAAFGYISCGSG